MAAPPLNAPLPEFLVLDDGYTITLDAIDPSTGAPVAGVVVSGGTVTAADATPGELPDNPPPLLTHVET